MEDREAAATPQPAAATAAMQAAAWGGLLGAAFGHAATLPSPDCAGHHFDHA